MCWETIRAEVSMKENLKFRIYVVGHKPLQNSFLSIPEFEQNDTSGI